MARIRGHGEGTISQRADGRWEARMSLPNGHRRSLHGKTQRQVQQKLKQAQRDFDSGLPVISHTQTLGDCSGDWLKAVKPQSRRGVWLRYRGYIRNHNLPELGLVKLANLTSQQVQAMFSSSLDKNPSPTTVHRIHEALCEALHGYDGVRTGATECC
jgi:integrase